MLTEKPTGGARLPLLNGFAGHHGNAFSSGFHHLGMHFFFPQGVSSSSSWRGSGSTFYPGVVPSGRLVLRPVQCEIWDALQGRRCLRDCNGFGEAAWSSLQARSWLYRGERSSCTSEPQEICVVKWRYSRVVLGTTPGEVGCDSGLRKYF